MLLLFPVRAMEEGLRSHGQKSGRGNPPASKPGGQASLPVRRPLLGGWAVGASHGHGRPGVPFGRPAKAPGNDEAPGDTEDRLGELLGGAEDGTDDWEGFLAEGACLAGNSRALGHPKVLGEAK